MRVIDRVLAVFRRSPPIDYGAVDPDDLEAYWRLEHDVDQAERRGDDALAAALRRWGLADRDHVERVKAALGARHREKPEFAMAAVRVQYERQLARMATGYALPPQYASPPHGVTIDRYAAIKARLDLGQDLGAILAELPLDPSRWAEVDQTWAGRMGPAADAMAGQFLRMSYGAMYRQAAAAYGRR